MRKLEVTITGAIGEGKTVLAKIIEEAVKKYNGTVVHAPPGGKRVATIEKRIIDSIKLHPEDMQPFEVTITGKDAVTTPEQPKLLVYRHGARVIAERS